MGHVSTNTIYDVATAVVARSAEIVVHFDPQTTVRDGNFRPPLDISQIFIPLPSTITRQDLERDSDKIKAVHLALAEKAGVKDVGKQVDFWLTTPDHNRQNMALYDVFEAIHNRKEIADKLVRVAEEVKNNPIERAKFSVRVDAIYSELEESKQRDTSSLSEPSSSGVPFSPSFAGRKNQLG